MTVKTSDPKTAQSDHDKNTKQSDHDKNAKSEKSKSDLNAGGVKGEESDALGSGCVKSTAYNIVTQVSLRIITFLFNAFILHRVDREVLGLINLRLTLLADTIIFLSREAFRLACQGHSSSSHRKEWISVLNLIWLSVPVSLLCSAIFSWIWINLLSPPSQNLIDQYPSSVILVSAGVVIQMVAESPSLVAQVFQFIRLRVILEFLFMAVKLFVLVYAVIFAPKNVVQVWAYGYLASSLLYTCLFYICFALVLKFSPKTRSNANCSHNSDMPFTSIQDLLPRRDEKSGSFTIHAKYREVAVSFLRQGVMKQLLTEGERYLMTFLNLLTLSQQGTYDVVSNLGSLACRFIFRPVEDNAYFFFSQQWDRGVTWAKQENTDKRENVRVGLHRLLRLSLLFGLIILIFGYSYSDLLLTLYGGYGLAGNGGTSLLRAQCLLVACYAVNGITECFARSAMTQHQIDRFNLQLVYLSCVYLGLTWVLTLAVGPVGIVLANAANIGIRIGISIGIINQTFQECRLERPQRGLYPDNDILFLLLSTGTCLQLSEIYLYFWHPAIHFGIGALLFVIVTLAVVLKEEFIFIFVLDNVRRLIGKEKKD